LFDEKSCKDNLELLSFLCFFVFLSVLFLFLIRHGRLKFFYFIIFFGEFSPFFGEFSTLASFRQAKSHEELRDDKKPAE
jgi:hypothetical protein